MPQTLISKDFCKAGDLSPVISGFASASFLPSHSQQEAHFLFSFHSKNLSHKAFWKFPEAVKISKVKLPGLEA